MTKKNPAKEFKDSMQELVDKSDGIDKISISGSGIDGEIVIAEKKPEEEIINYSGEDKRNFTSQLNLACSSDELRPVMACVHFLNRFAYASDGIMVIKQSLEYHTILKPEFLEGKQIHKDSFKQILTYQIAEAREDCIFCKDGKREAEFMYSDYGKPPNFDAVFPVDEPAPTIWIGLNIKRLHILGKILHGSENGVKFTFRGNKGVVLTTMEYENQIGLIMPIALEPSLF